MRGIDLLQEIELQRGTGGRPVTWRAAWNELFRIKHCLSTQVGFLFLKSKTRIKNPKRMFGQGNVLTGD